LRPLGVARPALVKHSLDHEATTRREPLNLRPR
jgi:hypothetical protein